MGGVFRLNPSEGEQACQGGSDTISAVVARDRTPRWTTLMWRKTISPGRRERKRKIVHLGLQERTDLCVEAIELIAHFWSCVP